MNYKIDILINEKCLIAECPSYDKKTNNLYWVDIFKKSIYKYNFLTKKTIKRNVNKYVSYIIPSVDGSVIVGLQDGVYKYNFEDNTLLLLGKPQKYDPLTYRFNDGKCDAEGRLWTGTTAFFEETNNSCLYKVNNLGNFEQMLNGINVSNGLGWSPDNKFMYYIDSGKKLIYQFNYNLQEGKLSEKKVIINFESEDANPDGMTVDADGMLWICHWGGYKISRWDPYKKEKIGEIILPVKQITCPTFVGEDFSKMVITTARYGCSREELNSNPDAGSIFILDIAGVSGIEPNLANM